MEDDTLLVIDDDTELCDLLRDYLGQEGFRVNVCNDGPSGLARALAERPDLVILDVMLPGASGFDVLRRLRQSSRVPVIMLTARGDDVDRIVGLEMGADDYLGKPFNPRELVARIRAVQRRAAAAPGDRVTAAEILNAGDVALDVGARVATLAGIEVELTSAELGLLELLLRSAGKVVSREDISEKVLGRKFSPYDRSIDVHVSNLRKKLAGEAGRDRIKTVRGTGYLFGTR
jgi:two-component system, OmpR family, response regulator CpxR